MPVIEKEIKVSDIDALREYIARQDELLDSEVSLNEAHIALQLTVEKLDEAARREALCKERVDAFPAVTEQFKEVPDGKILRSAVAEVEWRKFHYKHVNFKRQEVYGTPEEVADAEAIVTRLKAELCEIEAHNADLKERLSVREPAIEDWRKAQSDTSGATWRQEEAKGRVDSLEGVVAYKKKDAVVAQSKVVPELLTLSTLQQKGLLNVRNEIGKSWEYLSVPDSITSLHRDELLSIMRHESAYRPAIVDGDARSWYGTDGYQRWRFISTTLDLEFILVDERARAYYWPGSIDLSENPQGIIPSSHAHLSMSSIVPWAASPVPIEVQTAQIDELVQLRDDLRGFILCGIPGTSKTTYAAVYVKDQITLRALHHKQNLWGPFIPCAYRLKTARWLTDTQAWRYKDYEDKVTPHPGFQIGDIVSECDQHGFPPILWLEEIDKIKFTDDRRNILDELIDTVYEREGLVVITTNWTEAQLREELGWASARRVFGDNDEPEKFCAWSFFPSNDKRRKAA